MRRATARSSPTSITPAPSPGPTRTQGASVGKRPRYLRDDLYEQCSDHITEYMASSRCVGSRPSRRTMALNSSSVIPSRRCVGSLTRAIVTGVLKTSDSISKRLDTIEARLIDADPLTRLHLIQERLNLQNELESLKAKTDLTELEKGFISAAKSYGERKGITHAAWRALGVPPDVLRRAGISRGA